jgi:hypothetical protein
LSGATRSPGGRIGKTADVAVPIQLSLAPREALSSIGEALQMKSEARHPSARIFARGQGMKTSDEDLGLYLLT